MLESLDLPLGVVLGTFGVERSRITWRGQAAHAGSTPMDKRRDALAGAAKLALEIREIAREAGGGAVCTSGGVVCRPGIVTSVVETAEQLLDQRHLDAAEARADARSWRRRPPARFAAEENIEVEWERIWQIEPILFDDGADRPRRRGDPRGRGRLAPPPVGPAARRRRGLAGGRADGDALRPEPPRPLAHEARGHEGRAPRAVGRGARPARVEDDRARRRRRADASERATCGRAATEAPLTRGGRAADLPRRGGRAPVRRERHRRVAARTSRFFWEAVRMAKKRKLTKADYERHARMLRARCEELPRARGEGSGRARPAARPSRRRPGRERPPRRDRRAVGFRSASSRREARHGH